MSKTGYYGKMAAHGGFISNRLPHTFTTVWHDWSQQLVQSCAHYYPEHMDSTWYQLPSYRFALSSGLAGENVWIGLMIPSRDSVGRKFPLCVARPLEPNTLPSAALTSSESYLRALETVIAQLDDDFIDEQLATALETIDLAHELTEERASHASEQSTFQAESDTLAIRLTARLTSGASNRDLFNHAMLRATCGSYSVWMTSDISTSSEETLLCEGLPGLSASAALFDGQFDTANWSNVVLDNDTPQQRATPPEHIVQYNEAQLAETDMTMKSPLSVADDGNPSGNR